jgi:predicted methyltransferase
MRSYLAMKRSFTWFAVVLAAACQSAIPASAPITRERIAEIVASPDRSDADRTNDRRRRPELMLAFIGVRPGMVAMDLSAGGGYTTELIARAVGPGGKVYGQSAPPDPNRPKPPAPEGGTAPAPEGGTAPAPEGGTAPAPPGGAAPAPAGPRLTSAQRLAERTKNPAAGNIVPVVRAFEDPAPPEVAANALDLVTLMFNYHDLGYLGVDRARMNRAAFAALKPGGMYVVADHAGRPGTGISEGGTLHRVEEALVRREIEAAGFRLADEGQFLRNPADPRDRNTPDPPMPKDEFVLKFVKP